MPKKSVWPPRVNSNNGHDRVWIPAQPGHPGYWLRLGPTGSAEAHQAFLRLVAEMPTADAPPPVSCRKSEPLVGEILADYLAHYSSLPRSADAINRVRIATTAAAELYGALPATEFRGPQLRAIQRHLAGRNLTRTYVGGLIAAVRAAFRHAVADDRIPAEGLAALAAVRGLEPGEAGCAEPTVVEPVSVEVVEATLPHLRPPVAAMVRVQLLTGMRPGELCRLTPGQIHRGGTVRVVGRGSVDVGRLGGVWVYAPEQHKTARLGYGRYVAIGPQAQAALEPWLAGRAADAPCFSPAEDWERQLAERAARRRTPLWPSHARRRDAAGSRGRAGNRGERYTVRGYARAVARAAKAAGVEHWHPHQLRHAAEVVVELAFDLDAARATLGHRDARTTARYGVRDVLRAAEVARKIG